tara:strand:- start:4 stop:927 length:924 start_codon:yes stop_codon:yes gene_type:complete
MFDLAILGGGPAACAAAVYAARKKLKTVVITKAFDGQSIVSPDIHNWIGEQSISGMELMNKLKDHVYSYESEEFVIKNGEEVLMVNQNDSDKSFEIKTNSASYVAKSVLVTTGSQRKKITVPGAERYDHKGITYCASCDGPFFADKDVVVIGGGNAGFESASQLLEYSKSVTLLQRSGRYKADEITVDRVLAHPKMTGILNASLKEIKGKDFVTSVVYMDATGKEIELDVQGVFVEIGSVPTTEFISDLVETSPTGHVVVNPVNQRTNVEGVWAAGDCTDGLYHQNNIAAGDAVKALEDLFLWLKTK